MNLDLRISHLISESGEGFFPGILERQAICFKSKHIVHNFILHWAERNYFFTKCQKQAIQLFCPTHPHKYQMVTPLHSVEHVLLPWMVCLQLVQV